MKVSERIKKAMVCVWESNLPHTEKNEVFEYLQKDLEVAIIVEEREAFQNDNHE